LGSQLFDFLSIGHFSERGSPGRRKSHEHQLVAEANELQVLLWRKRNSAEQFDGFLGDAAARRRRKAAEADHHEQKDSEYDPQAAADGT
jgi:hypothetical protein